MKPDPWTQALFATAPRICGRQLLPFSLSHSLLLRVLGNPFAFTGGAATTADLMQALDICARTHRQNRHAVFGGGESRRRQFWRWHRWLRRDLSIALESFRVYAGDFTRRAEYREAPLPGVTRSEPVPLASPAEVHLHRHMTSMEGMGYEEAWDCPVGLAWAMYDAWAEWKGYQKAVTDEDRELSELQRRVSAGDESAWEEMAARVKAQQKAAAA